MSHGGIFNGPTALGTVEQGIFRNAVGLGAVTQPCIFATAWPVGGGEAARAIQTEMKRRGANSLKVDGYWGNCSESVYQKLFGEPLSKTSIEKNFPITCSSFSKSGVFVPSKCTNGTDRITAPIAPEVVPPPTTPEPLEVVCQQGYVNDPVTGGCKLSTTTPTPPAPKPPAPKSPAPTTPRESATAEKSEQWIEGIPNLAVLGVAAGVVLIGIGAFVVMGNR